MAVDELAATRAADLLAMMSENFAIAPPKILPEDDGSVVLTWEAGDLKRYLTIDDSDIGIMDLNKRLRVKCVHDVDGNEPFQALMSIVGAHSVSSSVSDTDA